MPPEWTFVKYPIAELMEYKDNPRILTEKQKMDLEKSLKKFGFTQVIVLNADKTIISGHQRCRILAELGYTDVDCKISDRQLSEADFKELNIRDNQNGGEFDYDVLSNIFDIAELLEYGFSEDELGLGKPEKKEKPKKPKVTFEFSTADQLLDHLPALEEIQRATGAKMQVRT